MPVEQIPTLQASFPLPPNCNDRNPSHFSLWPLSKKCLTKAVFKLNLKRAELVWILKSISKEYLSITVIIRTKGVKTYLYPHHPFGHTHSPPRQLPPRVLWCETRSCAGQRGRAAQTRLKAAVSGHWRRRQNWFQWTGPTMHLAAAPWNQQPVWCDVDTLWDMVVSIFRACH